MSESIVSKFNTFKRQCFNYIDANKLHKKSDKVKVAHLKGGLDEAYSVVKAFNLEYETVETIFVKLQKYVKPKKVLLLNSSNFLNGSKRKERHLISF